MKNLQLGIFRMQVAVHRPGTLRQGRKLRRLVDRRHGHPEPDEKDGPADALAAKATPALIRRASNGATVKHAWAILGAALAASALASAATAAEAPGQAAAAGAAPFRPCRRPQIVDADGKALRPPGRQPRRLAPLGGLIWGGGYDSETA